MPRWLVKQPLADDAGLAEVLGQFDGVDARARLLGCAPQGVDQGPGVRDRDYLGAGRGPGDQLRERGSLRARVRIWRRLDVPFADLGTFGCGVDAQRVPKHAGPSATVVVEGEGGVGPRRPRSPSPGPPVHRLPAMTGQAPCEK